MTVTDGFNTSCFNVYLLQNRKPFKKFCQALLQSTEDQYTNWIDLHTLARKHRLISVGGRIPSEEEIEKAEVID